jgi:CheY-like chemotaxis protein
MPIVDGLSSTKMIRSFEKVHSQSCLSSRARINGRVPIFAVSASLVEREKQTYINAGFDGWILKPIDFKRLNTLLLGIVENDIRNSCLYAPGEWERGGWFHKRRTSVSAQTSPSGKGPAQNPQQAGPERLQLDMDSLHSSESGSITPINEPRLQRQFIFDERLEPPKEVELDVETGTAPQESVLPQFDSSADRKST